MHFYDRTGKPCYEVANASKPGELRPATVADARKHGWMPSVTEVLGIIGDPGLEWWKIRTHIEAALTEPRDGRALDDMIPSIRANAEEFSKVAREMGTAVHDTIEGLVRCYLDDTFGFIADPRVPQATIDEFEAWYIDHGVHPSPGGIERSFACEYGWGGRIDLDGIVDGMPTVVDWKTQGTTPGRPFRYYPKWGAQLASYAYGIGHHIEEVNLMNVVFSTTEPGRMDYKIWPNNRELLCAFFAAFELYKGPLGKNYDPLNFAA